MIRNTQFVWINVISLLLNVTIALAEPNEPADVERRRLTPTGFIDRGGWLPAPAERSTEGAPAQEEEWLFATYSFRNLGTVYDIEFYYRGLHSRLRMRVLVGDRELRGLFNRFYGFPSQGRCMLFVGTDDGCPTVSTNFTRLVLKESDIDTDAIYDALERFLDASEVPRNYASVYMYPPPGLLGKTCRARIMALRAGDYLISEEGQVERLTLESLLRAYSREGIRAESADDYKEIAWSIIVAEHESTSRYEIVLLSHVRNIPGYASGELDSEKEAEVQASQFRSDTNARRDYWTCYAYQQFHGVVARYTFAFYEGRLQSAERLVLGEGIGNAFYLGGELPPTSYTSVNSSRSHRSHSGIFGAVSAGVGVLLLLIAVLARWRSHTRLERRSRQT